MHKEMNCRTTNLIVAYTRALKPEALPQLLDGYSESELTHEYNWTSYQTVNILFQRAAEIFGRDDVTLDMARRSMEMQGLGIIHLLIRLVPTVKRSMHITSHFLRFFGNVSQLNIATAGHNHVRVTHTMKPGFLCTQGICGYVQGLFLAILDSKEVRSIAHSESCCAVPIWEKGRIGDYRFAYQQGRIIRQNVHTGQHEVVGTPGPDGSFTYEQVTYGAPSCVYDFHWTENHKFWLKLVNLFSLRSRILEGIQAELLHAYDIFEKQNLQMQTSNLLLEELLQERLELTRNLEAKVAERTAALEDTVAKLQELDSMKSYFLSITSHELRTPLTIIKGALNLLQTDRDHLSEERVKKYLAMAEKSTDRLTRLLSDLLDLSRLDAGHLKLDLESVDVVRLVQESLEDFRYATLQRGLTVHADLSSDLPKLIGDEIRIKQMIDNLLSNAIKFTPTGGTISVRLVPDETLLQIVVEDTGIGISLKDQVSIFNKFQQVNGTLTRETGGVGLGLTIVRDLAQLHGGSIEVKSEVGHGSRFLIRLPYAGPPEPEKVAIKKKYGDREPPLILGR